MNATDGTEGTKSSGGRIAFLQAQSPLDAAQDMLLVGLAYLFRVFAFDGCRSLRIPHIFSMTERGVEDAACAIKFAPGDGVIARRVIVGMLVQKEQTVDLRAVEMGEQIDF